jgi:hypothetical protein
MLRGDRGVIKGVFLAACLVAVAALGTSAPRAAILQDAPQPVPPPAERYGEVVKRYCVTCHNQRTKTGDLVLEALNLGEVSEHADVWERVVHKLRTGAMPPPGAARPDPTTATSLVAWLETELDRAAAAHPNPGRPVLHRLNRTEYANAVRDLLALNIGDIASLLPPDDSAYGFDNNAEFLGVSRVLLESYLSAAEEISSLAVGDTDVAPGSDTYRNRQDLSQDKHLEGLPLGTVGGLLVEHNFPADGEYVLQARLFRTNVDQTRGLEHPHQLEITVDGERVYLTTVGPPPAPDAAKAPAGRPDDTERKRSNSIDSQLQVRLPIKAGPRSVGVAFVQRSRAVDAGKLQPYLRSSFDTYDATGVPHIEALIVQGPFKVTGPGDTPSRQRIFICRPSAQLTEEACASRILATLARRAYRQAVSPTDLRRLLEFYREGRADGTFESGIQRALLRILASPKFVLQVERDPVGLRAGSVYRLPDVELASRLSFFLWSTAPDDELLNVALQGRLKDKGVLLQQVRRMLASPRSDALIHNFAGQWLQLRNLQRIVPDPDLFPDFDDNLRQAFEREAELLFASIVREDRNVLDLMTADYTFVNERLAKHYGIPNVYGDQFRRVQVSDDARKGLLGKGAILLLTSNADRTSPVVRGKWILDNLLGSPPPSPPNNVPPLKDNKDRSKPLTMREQMEEHRANPVCASCHKLMDPLGFALENFDAVGAWRDRDAGGPIDSSSQLFDGTKVNGAVELRQALLKHQTVFVETLTEKLLTYAIGRGLQPYDMPAVRGIVRSAERDDNRFSSIIIGIVTSTPFQMKVKSEPEVNALSTAAAVVH